MKKLVLATAVLASTLILTACSGSHEASKISSSSEDSLETIIDKAKTEGELSSVGMPDSWANWEGTWKGISSEYSIKHTDTDMSSAEELAKFEAEGKNGSADIGDVGISFGPLAVSKDLTLAYKTSYWEDVPSWAKDDEGKWLLSYTGTIAFIVDTQTTSELPSSWKELAAGKAKVSVGDVTVANQAQFGVLAAAMANDGNESNITPGLEYFKKIAQQGRLSNTDSTVPNLEKGEVQVGILWDFNALNYRDQIDHNRYKVIIPTDGSVMSGYSTIINKNAPHPNAAKLAREYILSDKGQINLAKGYARPIRENVKLPEEVKKKLLPDDQYQSVTPVKDNKKWDEVAKELPELWQSEVLSYAK
jgi:putative spermidine/putrescine transport system substrate-binding protein